MDDDLIDLAALRTMLAIVERGSFSAAARRLEVKQSTVSYRIGRLRATLGDPLFVREGAGVRPTERCLSAAAQAERLFDAARTLVEGDRFDPATARGEAVIACNVYERALLLPPLVRRLRAAAPGLRLTVAPALSRGAQLLRDGGCDLLLSPRLAEHDGFDALRLFDDEYVVAMDAGNPLAAAPLTPDAYRGAAHVVIDYGGGWRSPYLDAAAAAGIEPTPALSLPSPGELSAVLRGSDLVATIPARFAATLDPARIATLRPPFAAGLTLFAYTTVWARTSPRITWLRGEAASAAAG